MVPAVAFAMLSGALAIAQFIIAKATRDSLFLTHFQATLLPNAVIGTSIAALPVVLAGSRMMTRIGPQRFLRVFLLGNAVAFWAEWALQPLIPRVVAGLLYLHVGVSGGLCLSGFWSIINERFDPHAARSVFGRISAATTIGGLLGGITADRLATWFGVRSMLFALGLTNLLLVCALLGVGTAPVSHEEPPSTESGLATLARSDYLQRLALLVVMSALGASTLDYVFKSSVADAISAPERLAKFFALYYMATGFGTVVIQSTAARVSLERFGIGVTLSVLPLVMITGGTTSLVLGGVAIIVILRGTEAVLSASFFRSAYEPLYTPLPPAEKRATKAIVDVAADRLGDALGSVCILVALTAVPAHATLVGLLMVIVAAAVTLWQARKMQRGYVAALASSLEQGVVRLLDSDVRDATTRLTVSQTHGEIDRVRLLRELAALRKAVVAEPELAAKASDLVSGDPSRITPVLLARPFDRRLVSFALPLLEYEDLRVNCAQALESVATNSVGQLGDALLDPQLGTRARYRVPPILATVQTTTSVRALANGLLDSDFEMRRRCARSLLALRLRDETLSPPEPLIVSAIRRELDVSPSLWKSRASLLESDDPNVLPIADLTGDYSLKHVFTLLCLCRPPDVMVLALRALRTEDVKLRGTALEYLENVIPPEIKTALWPHIADRQPSASAPPAGPPSRRSNRELSDELKRSFGG